MPIEAVQKEFGLDVPRGDFQWPPVDEVEEKEEVDVVDKDKRDLKWLRSLVHPVTHKNVAELLDEDELSEIGSTVKRLYEIDKDSRQEWEQLMEKAMKLARQVIEVKNSPWENASAVKYPLLTVAAIQFAARAYPEIVKGQSLVKAKIYGPDPQGIKQQRGDRISKHMSYQLLEEMEEWEEGVDKLLHIVPIVGLCYKKTYYDPLLKRNRSDLALADDVVIHYKAKSINTVRRITHEIPFYPNDIHSNVAEGVWLDQDLGLARSDDYQNDEDAPHVFLEQHCFFDLDDDGYKEPYVVTIHKETNKVVRIVPRFEVYNIKTKGKDKKETIVSIRPNQHFTKYGFIPNPDGSFYDMGFGWLLGAIGESINSIINQLIDAGTLANSGGGFITGIRLKTHSQELKFKMGEYKPVQAMASDIRAAILPIPFPTPSPVLFQLLSLLIEAGKDITTIKDVMTGGDPGTNVPATTTLAMIEQAQKILSGIYKRIYRSLKQEYGIIYRLNGTYLDDFVLYHHFGVAEEVARFDYAPDGTDVVPVASPEMTSDVIRMAKAQALVQLGPRPGLNQMEVTKRVVEALKTDDIEQIFDPKIQAPPNPKMMQVQAKAQIDQAKLQMEARKMLADMELIKAQIKEITARTILALAKAESTAAEPELRRLELYSQNLDSQYDAHTSVIRELIKQEAKKDASPDSTGSTNIGNPAAVPPVEAGPSNQGGQPNPGGV